ncbi:MAG TPA: hypothetical protein VGP06_16355 [Janthinobacterium sp.]|nr:hypothetical protein [Janthinobacterium sp.]
MGPAPALDRFSLSAGVFYADPSIGVNANTSNGRIDTGSSGSSGSASISESTFAPLLELGWRHAFTPDVRM